MNIGIKNFFGENKHGKIYSYSEYVKFYEEKIAITDIEKLSEHDKIYFEYSKLNLQRTNRIIKTFKPNPQLLEIINKFSSPQTWLVITEDWCGDSAQNLPYFVKHAEYNRNIEILIILRDSNLDAIDKYFNSPTSRAIPKIICFDRNGNELFIWGPRPKFAQDLVNQLKSEGFTKEKFNEQLHLWYGRNRGKELELEMINLFTGVLSKIL